MRRESGTLPPLHVVTDDDVLGRDDFLARAREVLEAGRGAVALHVRGPRTSGRVLHDVARELRAPAREAGATLLVNDRADVVRVLDLDGVHLGARSLEVVDARSVVGPARRLGVSVHDPDQARRAGEAGADYLLVGAIFETTSHPGRQPAGTGLLEAVARPAGPPALGIGGVTPERVARVLAAGGRGVAVVSGVWASEDPARAVERYLQALAEGGMHGGPRVR